MTTDKKQPIRDAMMVFMKDQYGDEERLWRLQRVDLIVDGVSNLQKDGEFWTPSFYGGMHIEKACDVAWAIFCHTNEPVRFRFNGACITMQEGE